MTPSHLRHVGTLLYGHQWQTPLAADLGVAVRTVQRWVDSSRSCPDLTEEIRAIVQRRIEMLKSLL